MSRMFPTVESQREASRALARRLFESRMQRAGCSPAMREAFLARRIDLVRAGKV